MTFVLLILYTGGKIIGRYDAPAHEFLFPSNELSSGELRKVPLEKSRKYQVGRRRYRW